MQKLIDCFNDQYGNQNFKIYISDIQNRSVQSREHRHAEFEISLILSGKGNYNTESGILDIRPNDIFLFSANEYHHITNIQTDKDCDCMNILHIRFAPSFIRESLPPPLDEYIFMNIFLRRNRSFCNRLSRSNACSNEIRKLLLDVKNECELKQPCYTMQVRNIVISVLIKIFRYYGYADSSGNNSFFDYSVNMQKALTFINANYCNEITLNEIVAQATLSKTHFLRIFKSMYNMTTWDYINIRRIDKALELLSSTNETVLAIATKCGYNNTANFNRIFKRITKITPKEYRLSHRMNQNTRAE